jgi:hypothetical protein
MRSIRDGLVAGTLAGLLLVALLFFDEGPTNQLTLVAQSLGLDGRGESKAVAVLLVFLLAIIVGGLFGLLRRHPAAALGWSLLWGLVAGALCWAVLFVLFGGVVQRLSFSLYTMMLYLAVSLVYGLALGSIYTTLRR